MNKYEELIEKSELCIEKASKQTDSRLTQFFVHAAVGFRTRAEKLEVGKV